MEDRAGVEWSSRIEVADWIGARLAPFGEGSVSSVVPQGFDAYARILHPATRRYGLDNGPLRWSELADWSGLPLGRGSQFHSVALPPEPRTRPSPLGQGPRHGSLEASDLGSLIEILARHGDVGTPYWFCVWEGFGWEGAAALTAPGEPSPALPDPVPEAVRSGPRVRLPGRDYLLYGGPVGAAAALMGPKSQSPNLWWPEDRSCCVATEIDLSSTYLGGSHALVSDVLASHAIESVPSAPDDLLTRIEPWVQGWIDHGTRDVLESGSATIVTPAGVVEATLIRPGRLRAGSLATTREGPTSSASGHQPIRDRDEARLEQTVAFVLTNELVGLVGQ